MKRLIYNAIVQRKITLFLVIVLVLQGFYSYYAIPKQENPDLDPSIAMIITIYPGGLPQEVDALVTRKIEDAVSDIPGFKSVDSISKNSVSIVTVYLHSDADTEKAWTEMRQNMDDLAQDLPFGCFKPSINTNLGETAGIILAVSGDNTSYDQLNGFAERFSDQLGKIQGIRKTSVVGNPDQIVKVRIAVDKLNQTSLSLEEILMLLKAQNVEIPAGSLDVNGVKIEVAVPGIFENLKDIENTVISVSKDTGAVLRLKDIASVSMGVAEDSPVFRENGARAVLVTGYFENDENVVHIGKEARAVIDSVKKTLPPSVHIEEVLFQPDDVSLAINKFMRELLAGIFFVILVVFVGMGFRNALVVSTAIPFSVLLTFIFMYYTGMKIHQISTASLIIALGTLVDNAIVISDTIQVRLDKGMDRVKAAYEGTMASAVPVLTSTLTTCAAYVPLLFIPGQTGQYVISVPELNIVSMAFSYFVAMLVTPTMAFLLFKNCRKKMTWRKGLLSGSTELFCTKELTVRIPLSE